MTAMKFVIFLSLVVTIHGQRYFAENVARLVLHVANQEGYLDVEKDFDYKNYLENDEELSAGKPKINIPVPVIGSNPKVATTSGVVEGTTGEAHAFYEIPYAEPPVGELRFQPPQPVTTPVDIDGTENDGLQCHQIEAVCINGPNPVCNRLPMDEDCLVLNVFSPVNVNLSDSSKPPSERLPVLFYIHGGSFFAGKGTSSALKGSELANATDTVVVTINYRLGALGFLVHKETGYPDIDGNQGFKDQQLAMKWVQDNIANFGGDKDRVTIFGNSAGAQSVMLHTVSEVSKPLYARAIQESNPAVFSFPTAEMSRQQTTDYLLKSLRCNETLTQRECLMTAEPTAISNRQLSVMFRSLLNGDTLGLIEPYRPVLDGEEFTDQPLHLFRDGKWNKEKNMIIGINTEELGDFEYLFPPGLDYSKGLFAAVNYFIFGIGVTDRVVEKYASEYPPPEGKNWLYTFSKEITHLYFICPSRAMARYASQTTSESADVYYYVNEHPVLSSACAARNVNGSEEDCNYCTHASEVRFVFRTRSETDENDKAVENQFSTYWGSFARTGSPSDGLETSLGDFENWPLYTPDFAQPLISMDDMKFRGFAGRYAKILPMLVEAAKTEKASSGPWQNIRIKAPGSEVEGEYEEDICDFWDSVGYYMDPIPLATTTTTKATTPITRPPVVIDTTSGAARPFNQPSFLLLACVVLLLYL